MPDGLHAMPALASGAGLGRAWARVGGPRTQVGARESPIAFPHWSEDGSAKPCSFARWRTSGAAFVEFARSRADGGPRGCASACASKGSSTTRRRRKRTPRGGVIALTGHFGSWEMLVASPAWRTACPVVLGPPRLGTTRCSTSLIPALSRGGGRRLPAARHRCALGVLRALRKGIAVGRRVRPDCPERGGRLRPLLRASRVHARRAGADRDANGRPRWCPVFLSPPPRRHPATSRACIRRVRSCVPRGRRRGGSRSARTRGRMTAVIEDEIRRAPRPLELDPPALEDPAGRRAQAAGLLDFFLNARSARCAPAGRGLAARPVTGS